MKVGWFVKLTRRLFNGKKNKKNKKRFFFVKEGGLQSTLGMSMIFFLCLHLKLAPFLVRNFSVSVAHLPAPFIAPSVSMAFVDSSGLQMKRWGSRVWFSTLILKRSERPRGASLSRRPFRRYWSKTVSVWAVRPHRHSVEKSLTFTQRVGIFSLICRL